MMEEGMKNDPEYDHLVLDIADALRGIREMSRQNGIFDGLRELYSCLNCGLKEDVAFDGRLMTYHEGAETVDTGLRFPEPDDKNMSVCPECGAVVVSEEEDFDCQEERLG